jgi:hypothetical protein
MTPFAQTASAPSGITPDEVNRLIADAFPADSFRGNKLLLIVPDSTIITSMRLADPPNWACKTRKSSTTGQVRGTGTSVFGLM